MEYALRILRKQPHRLAFTITGIALCILLMMFLLAIYEGVKHGSVEYIRRNEADLWVLQRNAWNILRGSSILSTGHGVFIEELPEIKSATPILLLLSGIKKDDREATVFLTGFQPEASLGGPPHIIEGRSVQADNEIVLDQAFAEKFGYRLRDRVRIHDDELTIVGLSTGTNALVIQYAFVTLKRAQDMIRVPSIVTCFLVRVESGYSLEKAAASIQEELPGVVEVYDHPTFLQNNIREMEAGFLPFIATIALIGIIVLTVILSLLLSINILEQRRDFAVMKALGSPAGSLWNLIIHQALLIAGAASLAALLLLFPMLALIKQFVPEISTVVDLKEVGMVVGIVAVMSLLSAVSSMQRIRRIYPLEAFA